MQNVIKVLWENYYKETPLTLWEFVKKQTRLTHLFYCVEEALKRYDQTFYDNPLNVGELYLSGPIGTGKGTYANIIMAYRLYLSMLLDDPKERIFKFSGQTPLDLIYFGNRSDIHVQAFIHFIEGIQDPENPIFYVNHTEDCIEKENVIVINTYNGKRFPTANYKGNEVVLRWAKNNGGLVGANPLIVHLDCEDGLEPSAVWDYYQTIVNRMESRFGMNKDLFTSLIIEKYPDNLYSDLMDQHIHNQKVRGAYLVETLAPPYMRDVNPKEAALANKYFIDIYTGCIDELSKEKDYMKKNPGGFTVRFPEFYETAGGSINLLEIAKKNPKNFINDFLGLPVPVPLVEDFKVTDSLSALNTVKKLIEDYHIKLEFEQYGLYLTIPGTDMKIKV